VDGERGNGGRTWRQVLRTVNRDESWEYLLFVRVVAVVALVLYGLRLRLWASEEL